MEWVERAVMRVKYIVHARKQRSFSPRARTKTRLMRSTTHLSLGHSAWPPTYLGLPSLYFHAFNLELTSAK